MSQKDALMTKKKVQDGAYIVADIIHKLLHIFLFFCNSRVSHGW